jgi:hypothetical protein
VKKWINVLTGLTLAVLLVAAPVTANTTITGEVGDSGEIIANNGMIYAIAGTEKGEELASMVGETVTVTGTVQEAEGEKILTVESFKIVPE